MPGLVWFITGTSTGFGSLLTKAALARGDRVIATARGRSLEKLAELKALGAATIELDVTAPQEKLNEVAKEAVGIYGQIDVLVNNAGYFLVGAMESNTAEETLDQWNANVFGALNVTRAILPHMRERKSGIIMWSGSIGGWRDVPYAGIYATTKMAARGLSISLNAEIEPLGVRSMVIDYGYFRTSFLTADHRSAKVARIPDYQEMTDKFEAIFTNYNGKQPGDPSKAMEVIVDVAHGTGKAAGKPFPLVLPLGSDCLDTIISESNKAIENAKLWEDVARSTDFPKDA